MKKKEREGATEREKVSLSKYFGFARRLSLLGRLSLVESRFGTHLHILGEHIVRMQDDGTEIAYGIEFENNFDGFAQQTGRIVSPANPLIA